MAYDQYFKDVSKISKLDVYRLLKLYGVEDPCLQHAIKKLLCAGQRGAKSPSKDVQEAKDSLIRYQEMEDEDLPL